MGLSKKAKKDWVNNLRSGKYAQGKEVLRRGEAFCCLGVLADTLSPSQWRKDSWCWKWGPGSNEALLPTHILSDFVQGKLAKMNDNGESFERIAVWIEENL